MLLGDGAVDSPMGLIGGPPTYLEHTTASEDMQPYLVYRGESEQMVAGWRRADYKNPAPLSCRLEPQLRTVFTIIYAAVRASILGSCLSSAHPRAGMCNAAHLGCVAARFALEEADPQLLADGAGVSPRVRVDVALGAGPAT